MNLEQEIQFYRNLAEENKRASGSLLDDKRALKGVLGISSLTALAVGAIKYNQTGHIYDPFGTAFYTGMITLTIQSAAWFIVGAYFIAREKLKQRKSINLKKRLESLKYGN